jgi:hypothetical protein
MTARDWVIAQLQKDSDFIWDRGNIRRIEPVGDHGLIVTRAGRPAAVAFCCEPSSTPTVTASVVAQALNDLRGARMVVVFLSRQLVDPEAYDLARQRGITIETFGGLTSAIMDWDDIAEYQHREEEYLRRRLTRASGVTSVIRKGHRAWLLERPTGLRPLTIITNDVYEVTDLGFTAAINQYPRLNPDAFVATNPSTSGFGGRVTESAQRAGIALLTLNGFLGTIRQPWT